MHDRVYRIHLAPEPEGGYTITVPALPGCISFGETVDEALAMAREAITAYLESLAMDGEPIPESEIPDDAFDALIQINSPAQTA